MYIRLAITVLCFIALDIISGLIAALKNHTYKSEVMRQGLFHKCGEILAICFAYGCEYAFPIVGITVTIPLAKYVLVYIVIMETGSIIENIGLISPAINALLHRVYKPYTDQNSDSDKKG